MSIHQLLYSLNAGLAPAFFMQQGRGRYLIYE